MRKLFIIRDKNSGLYCSSTKNRVFDAINESAIFVQRKNAEQGIKAVLRFADSNIYLINEGQPGWTRVPVTELDLEVVACNLVPE